MTNHRYSQQQDTTFSRNHYSLGKQQYMQDMDYVLYNSNCDPVAFIEEKNALIAISTRTATSSTVDLNDMQFKVSRKIANKMECPLFLLINNHKQIGFPMYYIVAANSYAKEFMLDLCKKDRTFLSEKDYFNLECNLRKKQDKLSDGKVLSTQKQRFELPTIIDFKE